MDGLQFAGYCGDLVAVKKHLAQGADVHASDDFGYTALHWNARMACSGSSDRVAIVRILIEAGADPNGRDKSGATVLESAIEATAPADHIGELKSHGAT